MFPLDVPSTISYQQPSWLGGLQSIGGYLKDAVGAVYDKSKSYIDPTLKSAVSLEQNAVTFIENGPSELYSAAGDALSAAASKVGTTAATIFSPISTGLKWGIAIVVVLGALYIFAPFANYRR